MKPVVKYI